MDIDKILDKLFGEPQRERGKVHANVRLTYKELKENVKLYIFIAILIPLLLAILWIIGIITTNILVWISFIWVLLTIFYFQFRIRYCKNCSKRMVRQQIDSYIYYFCDTCKLKIKVPIGTDAS